MRLPRGIDHLEYDDGLIACSADVLLIRRYGPFMGSKKVSYAEIREVREFELNALRRWRLWGTTDPRRWFNLDWRRPHKRLAFLIDLGKGVTPVITPEDPQRVAAVLRSHGVEVRQR
jgi:hypothetical protein